VNGSQWQVILVPISHVRRNAGVSVVFPFLFPLKFKCFCISKKQSKTLNAYAFELFTKVLFKSNEWCIDSLVAEVSHQLCSMTFETA
jgi:hypothetical protein